MKQELRHTAPFLKAVVGRGLLTSSRAPTIQSRRGHQCGVSKGSALRLRLTGSVVQPLSCYDLLTYKAIGFNYLSFVVTSMLVFSTSPLDEAGTATLLLVRENLPLSSLPLPVSASLKIKSGLCIVKKIKPHFNQESLFTLHYSLILSHILYCIQGLRKKIFPGVRRSIPGPQILLSPQALLGPMPLNRFLSDGCTSSFKSEGITIFAYS